MIADLKFALRMLVKAPGFTVIAVLTLALGIGANTAIFSVLDAVLLHPLSFPKPNELVAVWSYVARDNLEKETESIPDYVDLRDQSQTLTGTGGFYAHWRRAESHAKNRDSFMASPSLRIFFRSWQSHPRAVVPIPGKTTTSMHESWF